MLKPVILVAVLLACLVGLGMVIPEEWKSDNLPPAPIEYAEFFHFSANWPVECEPHMHFEGRAYDEDKGVLTYPWLGTPEQENECWGSAGPEVAVKFVVDSCPNCPEALPPSCESNLQSADQHGLNGAQMLREFYIHDSLGPLEFEPRIWEGNGAELAGCQRLRPLIEYLPGLAFLSAEPHWYFAVELKSSKE